MSTVLALSDALWADVETRIRELFKVASRKAGRIINPVRLRCSLTGDTAALAHGGKQGYINLNPRLLIQNKRAYFQDTIPHEVAHIVAWEIFGWRIADHGREWRTVMAWFGAEITVYHHYRDNSRHQVHQTYAYRCKCRTVQVSAATHREMEKGETFRCKSCGGTLHRVIADAARRAA